MKMYINLIVARVENIFQIGLIYCQLQTLYLREKLPVKAVKNNNTYVGRSHILFGLSSIKP